MNLEEIIKRQDASTANLEKKKEAFEEAERKFNEFFKEVDESGFKLIDKNIEKKSGIINEIVNLYLNNQKEYKKKLEEINTRFPIFKSKEFKESIFNMQKAQYEYYKELVAYLNEANDDYNTLLMAVI